MDIKTAIVEAIKELVLPELDGMKADIQELKSIQEMTNKRLDDLNGHFLDLSRRIDQVRTELNERLNQERTELGERIDAMNARLDTLREAFNKRIDAIHERLDRLYEVIVRREEHEELR
ncbi:MAG: hypothetical protein ONB05_11525, partial [candidate division KSB1 bacterium]|nr:hypothetical protein [candidate division KSB1 bacterium]